MTIPPGSLYFKIGTQPPRWYAIAGKELPSIGEIFYIVDKGSGQSTKVRLTKIQYGRNGGMDLYHVDLVK